jgi:hypothetical protein
VKLIVAQRVYPRPAVNIFTVMVCGVLLLITRLLAWLNRDWQPTDYTAIAREQARLKRQHEADVPWLFD